ncbi:Spo0E family sporulation regulatory protein-aspartic acid phosphatase [Sporolactobacillus kofuensis]|uniref:Spo0E family sporulation regulatory protein-aspartic acid phosphatase n=1 Tax=Sporolactobacillus kofuensis TaxID=269672 RepID=A0ABW1WDJ1_9BACL|nr:aspartyl-phosphate phosphatase Spo0E family protein [Sporolactobacillus kofuensis]MCO7174568.1 aspartyl-phosphate phosphatase Spo0E family protein [Sporolactobacillus kofuensis]
MSDFLQVGISQESSSIYSEDIEQKRQELLITAKQHGIFAEETLRCSQELDLMIIDIQEKNSPMRATIHSL